MLLEISDIRKTYRRRFRRGEGVRANDGITLRADAGQVYGLLGHNGAGKTTVMRMLSGFLEPCAGTIHIGGVNLAEGARLVQQRLGYLPEYLPVYPDMMVADYLDYAATLKGIDRQSRPQAVRHAIVATDLAGRALDPVNTLSRGLKQRVGVAQAILGKPRLLILDEPTNGLDPKQTEHMRRLIRHLARQATVILSTHIMQEVAAICDRVLVLRNGKLVLNQKLDALHHSRTLLLRTDTGSHSLSGQLGRLPQLASLQVDTDGPRMSRYILTLADDADIDATANQVACCVVEAGAKLYQLQSVVRDLETVFREVNADGS